MEVEDTRPLAVAEHVRWSARGYETTDLEGVTLVIAATDDPLLQERIARESRSRTIFVNVADAPALGDFYTAAVVNRDDLQIAVSTGGAAPALSKFIRQKLEAVVGPEYAALAHLMKEVRPALQALPQDKRSTLWNRIASEAFIDQIRQQGSLAARTQINEWIKENSPC